MIDNNDKDLLRSKWNFKIYALYFLNGIKSISGNRRKRNFVTAYFIVFAFIYFNRFWIFGVDETLYFQNLYGFWISFAVIVFGVFIFFFIMFLIGMPSQAKSLSDNFP